MPATSYNLRKRGAPTKAIQRPARSPAKKRPLLATDTVLADIPDLPAPLLDTLTQLSFTNLNDLRNTDAGTLWKKIASKIRTAKDERMKQIEGELIQAWLRFLAARARDEQTSSWQDWIDVKLADQLTGIADQPSASDDQLMAQAKNMLKMLLSKRDLIRQRQALKRKGPPKGESKAVTREELRNVKKGLQSIPSNKAISDKVKTDDLQTAKTQLKPVREKATRDAHVPQH